MAQAKRSWLLQEFSAHTTALSSLTLGKKSGRVMATGGEDGVVNLWPVGTPTYLMKFTGHSSAIESLCFNGSEESVCAGSRSGLLRIWDIGEGKIKRSLTGHKAAVSCLDFHTYGEFLASGSLDHKVKMWDIRRKGCINTYTGHEGAINALHFSPDGRWLTSCSDDGTCKIWDLPAGKMLHQFKDHSSAVTCFQFHPNELLMATGSKDRTVKIYDVEQFRLLSSSRPQANAVLRVVFSETGHCIFAVSQDMCQVHVWEPEHAMTDSLLVKWGRPADVVISGKQLISAAFRMNIVSNYVVDLTQTNASPLDIPQCIEPFQPPATGSATSRVTERPRPPTACEAVVKNDPPSRNARQQNVKNQSTVPVQINVNNNNIPGANKPEDVFHPTRTLCRSPSGSKPTSLPVKEEKFISKNAPTPSPHQATNILPHLTPDPVVTNHVEPEKPEKDSVPVLIPAPAVPSQKVNDNIFKKPTPLEEIPTKDQNIPEKLEEEGHPVQNNIPQLPDVSSLSLNESRLSTIVPMQRQGELSLDMNAFLPPEKDPSVTSATNADFTDEEAASKIRAGFESMSVILASRYKNLEIVRALWSCNDVMTSMITAVRMKDIGLLVDLLSILNLKSSLWTLDLCQLLLPDLSEMIKSRHETHVAATCSALKIVLQNFGPLVKSNVSAPPTSAVDLSREERYRKCKACHKYLCEIRTVIENAVLKGDRPLRQFKELNILMNSILD